jgi:hypothetical protein
MNQTSQEPKQEPKETNVEWQTITISSESGSHKHYFEWRDGECKCKLCSFGLMGVVDIVNGRPI